MGTFAFRTLINIKCGCGSIESLGSELKQMGFGKVYLVTDPGLSKAGLSDRVTKIIANSGIAVLVFDSIEPNPRDTTIEKAWEKVKDQRIEAVVGLGGGSALDGAKATAVLATNGGRLVDYDGVGKIKKPALPIIAIPTTAGTGSEVTSNAAITDTAKHYKMSLRSPHIIPALCILDADLLATLPPRVAAESSMDAIVHAAEGFLSNRSNDVSDALAIQAMEYLCPNIRPFVADRSNTRVSEKMIIGSMFAGTVIGNTGTGNDHALARALGGVSDTAHGLACALLYPYVVRFNFIANPPKYRRIAELFGLDVSRKSDSSVCDLLVQELFRLLADLGIPHKLSAIGIPKEVFPKVAEVGTGNSGPNPRKTSVQDMMSLLEEAF